MPSTAGAASDSTHAPTRSAAPSSTHTSTTRPEPTVCPHPNCLSITRLDCAAHQEFWRVDLFVCSHPVANCELFLPFDRALIVYATTRLEFGRFDLNVDWRKPFIHAGSPRRWAEWIHNLRMIAARPGNVVAANSMFDVHYIKYHTGIDAVYLPSWCAPSPIEEEQEGSYWPSDEKAILLGPYRDNLGSSTKLESGHDTAAWRHPIFRSLTAAVAQARADHILIASRSHPDCVAIASCRRARGWSSGACARSTRNTRGETCSSTRPSCTYHTRHPPPPAMWHATFHIRQVSTAIRI